MVTITILIWMFALVLFFHGLTNYMERAIESDELSIYIPKTLILSWLLIHLFAIGPISIGLFYDLFGYPVTDLHYYPSQAIYFYFLSGLVALGVTSGLSIWINYRRSSKSQKPKQGTRYSFNISPRSIFDAVAFVSSVLGIVSFYLDYIR